MSLYSWTPGKRPLSYKGNDTSARSEAAGHIASGRIAGAASGLTIP
ncbi:hypothetical protein [Paenibacillus sp. N3.4]|nr:hypothetical protein [Paenibacillus sp. N3.4]